jgi:hypothetical protein
MPAAIASVAEFVRRVVDGLLRGECRGRFLCARCLVRSYTTREVARAMEDVFRAPGRITHAAVSTCVACASSTRPYLGVTGP